MKITEMLQREDFYQINMDTLTAYYGNRGTKGNLYIYPRLNAIVTRHPSKAVRKYLLTEYEVRNSAAKRLAVQSYVRLCMSSFGLLADKRIELKHCAMPDTLIYPCNRKYRIFDFARQTVAVQIKADFPTDQLKHEIAFRTREDLPDFVPAVVNHNDLGYTEQIIDGRPLARISDGFAAYRQEAYALLTAYASNFNETFTGSAYAEKLRKKATEMTCETTLSIEPLLDVLCGIVAAQPQLDTTFSHGDLQPGNIWVENGTNKLFIIDWESWGIRSSYYDKATLFDGLRPGSIQNYLNKTDIPTEEKAVVLLEDLIFQLEEYCSLPGEFGLDRLKQYVEQVVFWTDKYIDDREPVCTSSGGQTGPEGE